MIPAIIFFIGLFIFVNFFDYAKTFYDIIPGEIVGDVNLILKEEYVLHSMGLIDEKYWKKYE